MDILTMAQYAGPAVGVVLVMGTWLKRTLDKVDALEIVIKGLNDEVKQDLRDMLPLLNETGKLLKEVGEDGNKEILEHLKLIKDQITNVQCHAKEKD